MSRFWPVFLLALVSGAMTASAAGYDDFASGMSAVVRGDDDQAIGFFTSALAAGDLHASLVPVAYLGRARAHMDKDECKLAAADASAAINLKSNYFEAYLLRGAANRCAGDDQSAIADFTQVIAMRPVDSAYWERGLARWNAGDYANAADDFSISASKAPEWPYPVIWFGLARLRSGTFDGADYAKKYESFSSSDWPAPVFGLFESHMKPEDVIAAAGKSDDKTAQDNLCEAHFYVAEWWIIQKNPDAAKPLLEDVRDHCRHDFVEYREALVELKRDK